MNFQKLVNSIQDTHFILQQNAVKAVNLSLTLRNWLIGFYIFEFEQKGEDRAKYGSHLLPELAKSIAIKGLGETNLKTNRQFYLIYPQIGQVITDLLQKLGNSDPSIRQLATDQFQNTLARSISSVSIMQVPPEKLITKLSYTHLVQLFPIEDPLKRSFYEIECIRGTWSVSELKRQIGSLYFERSGISRNPEKLRQITHSQSGKENITDFIKSPFAFEFIGLKAKDVMEESDLEQALIDHLQDFLLELGHGFCFEARQKRILIDDEYYFVDLVFYHRILKCHVLIDLKVERFMHDHLSQLNSYVAYYREQIMQPDDNPTIGILLCTEKGNKLVEYALSGMDEKIFVSKYLVALPTRDVLTRFIQSEISKLK